MSFSVTLKRHSGRGQPSYSVAESAAVNGLWFDKKVAQEN